MSNDTGRKAQIRQYAEEFSVPYTEALRVFERVDVLFARFKAEWMKVTDYPIRLDRFDVLVSLTPSVRESYDVDWDELERTDGFRKEAFAITLDSIPNVVHNAGLEPYDWTAKAALFNPDDEDTEARGYRVSRRVELAYRRLFGGKISMTDQRNGTTAILFFDEEDADASVYLPSPDLQDVERRRAYEEMAQQIHQIALDDGVFGGDADADDEVEWTPIDYTDKDWASKVTPEQFYAEQRFRYASGLLTPEAVAALDRKEPGWYDVWLNADPLSHTAYRRRLAICSGVVPGTVIVLNYTDDPATDFESKATGNRLRVTLTGTDEQMRDQVRDAVAALTDPI